MKKYIIISLFFLPHLNVCTESGTPTLQQKAKHLAQQIGHGIIIGASTTLGYIGYKTAHVFTGTLTKKIAAPALPLLALYPIVQHSYWLYKKSQPTVTNDKKLVINEKKTTA